MCMEKGWITSSPDTPSRLWSARAWAALFGWPVDCSACVEHGWTRLRLHFPTTSISSLGFSPWHFWHRQSFINAPPPLAFHALIVIGEMSSSNVNITLVCESGFLQGARKWIKTSEPIVFCHTTPFKCSSLPFWIWWRLLRLMAGPTGRQSGAGSALVALHLSQTYLFVLFGWINVIVCHISLFILFTIVKHFTTWPPSRINT